jgi:hypothetical protein
VTKDGGKPPVKRTSPAAAAPTTEVQAFKLNHADPTELQKMLTANWAALMAAHGQKAASAKAPALVVSERTRTLFARGSDKELEVLAKLIPALDDALGGKESASKDGRVLRLKSANVPEVIQVLTGLGLQGAVIGLPKANALFITNDAQAKAVRLVVEKLDAGEPARVSKVPPGKEKKGPVKDKR